MTTPDPAERQVSAGGPIDRLVATPIGTRIVVRSRIVSGFTDTIGTLLSCDGTIAELQTRTGRQQVVVAHVVAMRVVPPPPARRAAATAVPATASLPEEARTAPVRPRERPGEG